MLIQYYLWLDMNGFILIYMRPAGYFAVTFLPTHINETFKNFYKSKILKISRWHILESLQIKGLKAWKNCGGIKKKMALVYIDDPINFSHLFIISTIVPTCLNMYFPLNIYVLPFQIIAPILCNFLKSGCCVSVFLYLWWRG